MLKNIIFDLGGVLIDYNPEATVRKYFDEETAAFLIKELFRAPLWREVDRGTLTADELCRKTVFGRVSHEVYEKARSIVSNWGDYMPPFEDMPGVVEKIKHSGLNVYLLSNVPGYFYDIKDRIPALSYFDGFVISSDLKLLKPEPAIFEAALKKFGLKAEECLLVDDMPENVQGAKNCGLDGFVFNHAELDKFICFIKQNGINMTD